MNIQLTVTMDNLDEAISLLQLLKDNATMGNKTCVLEEKAAKEKAAEEKATKEKAAEEKAAKEKAAEEEEAAEEKAAKEKAAEEEEAAEEKAAEDEIYKQLAALWTQRKPVLATFGPSVADAGYACSDYEGCTHNSETDCPLPDYDYDCEHSFAGNEPDTPERMKALRKLAVERLLPGDLALVHVNARHSTGCYGYVVLPGGKTALLNDIFPCTAFEDVGPTLVVPRDLATPLVKKAIVEYQRSRGVAITYGIGYEYQLVEGTKHSWVEAAQSTLGVQLDAHGRLPRRIDDTNCFFVPFYGFSELSACQAWHADCAEQLATLSPEAARKIQELVDTAGMARSELDVTYTRAMTA